MSHTPGPWKVHPYRCNFGPHNKGIDVGPGQRMVARICGEFEQPEAGPEAEANARLIASAPDLLAALKEVRNSLALRGHRTKEQEGLLGMVRATIAKAEGR